MATDYEVALRCAPAAEDSEASNQKQVQDGDIEGTNGRNQADSQAQTPRSKTIAKSEDDNHSTSDEKQRPQIDFVTMGMFIIDDIDYVPPKPSVKGILGGAGSYSALGARLFSPSPVSSSIGWIVDKGSDFPPSVADLIQSWETSAVIREDMSRSTTRGWNGYEGTSEKRSFKYLTPKKRLTADDLTPELLQARSIHLICSPLRCQQLVADITARRKEVAPDTYTKAIFIWEPVPDLCTPDELLNCTNTLPLVDVCSPNHTELAGFMGDDGLDPETGEISTVAVERACEQLLGSMPLQSFSLVVRVGDKGCYIAKNGGRKRSRAQGPNKKQRKKHFPRGGLQPDTDMEALFAGLLQDEDGFVSREEIELDPGIERWIPAYHQDASKVVDPTGGGNTFLGGLAVALARGQSIEDAAIWGSVAASFAIEQVGMPTLEKNGTDPETWNTVVVNERLEEFKTRISS
ncbi:pfkB family carbohydrate kinase [Geosmithia morbida]|uniref:PfkB family carbohydrate kinase n=1 Tax=Geosmithia morbida TaxID=1094350 RepID=A0A9P4YZD2_9HYPO|nr:pfkB family carbohydrate kinase [Geosmithia morbida]KAF4125322.1 pfkB family carbohydrate kinase [Geosmithia morbida]